MKERILIVEDNFVNIICALRAFHNDENVEEAYAIGKFDEAVKMVEDFKPTLALLDINIIGGSGREVGKVLGYKNIPYIYVTGVGKGTIPGTHNLLIEAIEIQQEDEQGNMVTISRFEGKKEKESEIWRQAYEILKRENQ